eukprot:gene54456-20512_t
MALYKARCSSALQEGYLRVIITGAEITQKRLAEENRT